MQVNGDNELIVSSVLPHKETFRLVESFSRVYKKDNPVSHDGTIAASAVASSPKEKKVKKQHLTLSLSLSTANI